MKIESMAIETFWKGESRVQAEVEDENATYTTRIFIKGSQMIDYSCSCAEGNSSKGACRHSQALFQEFVKREREEKKHPVSTSKEVRDMIREYTKREVIRITGEEIEGEPAGLLPYLVIRHRSVALECRIKGSRTHVIRNLFEFSHAVRTGEELEYGRKMSFRHCPSAFSEKSRPLLFLVLEETRAYEYYYEMMRGRGYGLPNIRSVPLDRGARDRFFSIMEGEVVETEDYGGQIRSLLMVRKDPPFLVRVKKEEPEGISVSLPPRLMAFEGEKALYVADVKCLYCCSEEYAAAMGIFLKELLSTERPSYLRWEEYTVTIHKKDIPLFYKSVLSRVEHLGLLDAEGINWEEYRLPELQARFSFESSSPEEVAMEPTLSYGTYSFHPVQEEPPREICRDEPGEYRISRLITTYFKSRDEESGKLVIRGDEEALYRLLSEGLERFKEVGEVRLSDSFRSLRISPAPRISLGASVNRGWLELDVDTGGLSGEELAALLSQYKQKKKYYRMKSGEFLSLREDGLWALSRLTDDLDLEGQLSSKRLTLPAYRALYVDSIMEEDGKMPVSRNKQLAAMLRDFKSLEDVKERPPKKLEPVLREYQKTGFVWLKTLWRYGFGGILADDMGLGKTIQILALLVSVHTSDDENRRERGPSLVVCPASLIYNWGHECSVFAPSLRALLVTGAMTERKRALAAAGEYDVIITSYELLRRDLPLYREREFSFLILDEAQYIKNAATQNAKAVKEVKAAARFALTGTPVENRLAELWSIFDFLMPGFLFGYRKFKVRFETPVVKGESPEALESLRRMIRPFVLRRLKSDVLKELPPKLERVVYSAAEGRQDMLYRAEALRLKQRLEQTGAAEMGKARLEILAQLTRLRQICCDPSLCYENYTSGSAKLETAVSLIGSAAEAGHKILLFSQFASMLGILKERLEKEGLSSHLLTGATPKEERNRLVNAFQEDEVPVFLISLKAGGTGLNLTAADIVIHYDPWWNEAAQNQATDRAHRIGQERQVTVYKLIMKNTIEENIMKLQESKRLLADQIVTEGMVSLGQLGRDELLAILEESGNM